MNTAFASTPCFCLRESKRLEQIRSFRRTEVCTRAEKRNIGSKIVEGEEEKEIGRRHALIAGFSMASTWFALDYPGKALVKQGLLAGRIPGLSDPDERGWFIS